MMNNVVTMYKVIAWDGMCRETREERWFTTAEKANENIKAETWADIGGLYEVTFIPNENGRIEVVETTLKCPRTAREIECAQKRIDQLTQSIAEVEASKKRVRTENGMAKKEEEIEFLQKELAKERAVLKTMGM